LNLLLFVTITSRNWVNLENKYNIASVDQHSILLLRTIYYTKIRFTIMTPKVSFINLLLFATNTSGNCNNLESKYNIVSVDQQSSLLLRSIYYTRIRLIIMASKYVFFKFAT
jgi:hypothetical protein